MHALLRIRYLFWIVTVVFLFSSCEKDEETPVETQYLESYELVSSYSASQLVNLVAYMTISYPEIANFLQTVNDGADIYSVKYYADFQGEKKLASGLVCIPAGAAGSYPFLSFQNGTNTCNSNAPTENPTNRLYTLVSVIAGSGFIVTIPDYFGFGASTDVMHPYHHKQTSNSSVLDLLRAANELLTDLDKDNLASKDLFLMGYSQGGWATLAALEEIENTPITEFNVVATAAGAGAYDLYEMSKYVVELDTFGNPFYLPYFVECRREMNVLSQPLTTFFKEPYTSVISDVFDGSLCNTEVNEEFTPVIDSLLSDEMLTNFEQSSDLTDLRNELIFNSIAPWKVNSKLRLYHSTGDNSVPSFLSQELYDDLLGEGTSDTDVELINIELLDHNDAILPWGIDAITWLKTFQ